MRPFADLVDDLLRDVRRAPIADLELEAVSFAMALVWAAERPRDEAQGVVGRLSSTADPDAQATLRALQLLAPPVVREAAGRVPVDLSGRAADVGRFDVESAWRAVRPGLVADVVWFARPGGRAQSLFLVTASDDLGAALVGGGMSGDSDPGGLEERLARLSGALDVGDFGPVGAAEVFERMKRGAATNRALMSEVSVTLAMGLDIGAHALGGSVDAIEGVDWTQDDSEDDDERAAFLLRVLERAVDDGVDATDPDALAAWRLDFAELSPREQLRALGLPPIPSKDDPQRRRRAADARRRARRKAQRRARKRNR
jgi:hypothetical protein